MTQSDPEPVTEESDLPLVTTSLYQVLTGHAISDRSPGQCVGCGEAFTVGEIVFATAERCVERTRWRVPRLYCWGCAPAVLESPTVGVSEAIIGGRVGTRLDPTGQVTQYCLTEIAIRAYSPASHG